MRCIAHRGASAYAPENTYAAFELAIEMGADAIETDVQITRDGHLVLIHDDTVDRTTDGSGPVADHTLGELKLLDAGAWFGPAHREARIPTLEGAWINFGQRIPFVFEIKEPLAAQSFATWVATHVPEGNAEITSFNWASLLVARRLAPDARHGFLTPRWDRALIDRVKARGFAQVCPHVRQLTAELVEIAHTSGLQVRAWGIKERSDIALAQETGADGLTTNWPDWVETDK